MGDLDPLGGAEDLTIRGEIETSSVPELLRSLLGSGETGILTLRRGDATKSIFIQQGRVVYAASNNTDEPLGESLSTRGVGDIDAVLVPTGTTEVLYKLELTAEEQEVLSHVNGRATVEQICDVSYLSNFETCRILWALKVLGVIRRSGAEDVAAVGSNALEQQRELDLEAIVEKFNQMFGRIYHFLRGRLGEGGDGFMETCM